MMSKVKVEDHYNMLSQVKQLHSLAEIEETNAVQQCRHELKKFSTETLRGVAYEFLSQLNVDSHQTPFCDNLHRKHYFCRSLTPDMIRLCD